MTITALEIFYRKRDLPRPSPAQFHTGSVISVWWLDATATMSASPPETGHPDHRLGRVAIDCIAGAPRQEGRRDGFFWWGGVVLRGSLMARHHPL
ncbi:MAG: hypothetical protein R3245_04915 [Kiloniellales bacterium]|nr:hypothetical protein [Kiloniellales bacterium]